eukprot:CAMPEP_0169473140 /NCGR_PEP_ID=MMETSP1042-20121227/25551_1 /TAXON_ID=464988 /ORGANISM="Hemiselmis andersenii, Strain CCMP1180" /LENGTH=66 /DNA_ID=CAMNT_0009587057 /DNA_START=60 /DNA_END=260 /DNA_ORIENTATION=-
MAVLRNFLCVRFFQDEPRAFELLMNTKAQDDAILPDDLTLLGAAAMLWGRDAEMVLMYRSTERFTM